MGQRTEGEEGLEDEMSMSDKMAIKFICTWLKCIG